MRNQDHEQQDDHGDERQPGVVNDLARGLRFALLPIAEFRPVLNANLVLIGQVVRKILCLGVAIPGIFLQCAAQNFL